MYKAHTDILELAGDTFGMSLIKVEGKYWYGHKLCPEGFCDCTTKFGPYESLNEAVKNLNTYLKTYGGNACLKPACFDEQGNAQNPQSEKFHRVSGW